MKTPKWIISGLTIVATIFLLSSCNNESDDIPASSRLEVYLTDAPANYKAVWIDIQSVEVKASGEDTGGNNGWTDVPMFRPGLYNLLTLRNGQDTILAAVDLPAGKVSQIRLVLGGNNSIEMNDGTKIPLKTPSAQQSGLKLNIHATLEPGIPYALVLDFDAARSIVDAGNSNNYILKPVIRAFAKASGGAIEGVILPTEAQAQITAIQGTDTLGTTPNANGEYKLWGVPAGSYTLLFTPADSTGFSADTLTNVNVEVGKVTKLDTITLH